MMWDKPRPIWPRLVRTCVDLWIEINPTWNVEIFDIGKARELISADIDLEIFDTIKVQHQSDLVRTKLLSTRGGIWVDASCLPHMPVDVWIEEFQSYDYASIPSLVPGQISDNWFLLSKENGYILTKQYNELVRYWRTPKINLPQDTRSISMIAQNWRGFISDYSAHKLRIVPYFCWQYLFNRQVEDNPEFASVFDKQKFLSLTGECGAMIRMLYKNVDKKIPSTPMSQELRLFLQKTEAQLSKLNHHATEIDYPLEEFRECVLKRAAKYG
jgi:hypothetical protein